MILNAAITCSLVAPPPTSRKLAGAAAEVLDDVHRAHREAGAVDQAGDVAVERDVAEGVLGGLDLLGVLLVEVAQGDDLGMAEEGVVVERHLGVERQDLAGRRRDERIDLDHRGVGLPVQREERADQLGRRSSPRPRRARGGDQLAHLVVGQPVGRVDDHLEDLFGVSWATFSISTPPSVEATITGREETRSSRMAR
jgi:hypothetical protein